MNRIKQLIWAITSSFKKINNEVLSKYLNEKELKEFNKLSNSEKHHCIRVCNNSIDEFRGNKCIQENKLAKITLLHDVGKNIKSLNVVDKSLIVILDKITKGKLKKYEKNKKVYIYYNHPKESVKILNRIGKYDLDFIEAVEKHHCKGIYDNIYLQILKKYDDRN